MNEHTGNLGILRSLESNEFVLVVGVVVLAWLLASVVRWVLRRLAERAPLHLRLPILRLIPLLRLGVGIAALAVIVPILIEPTFQNIAAWWRAWSRSSKALTSPGTGSSWTAPTARSSRSGFAPCTS